MSPAEVARMSTAELDALIARVRQHPGLYAYYIIDEPNASQFAALGRLGVLGRESVEAVVDARVHVAGDEDGLVVVELELARYRDGVECAPIGGGEDLRIDDVGAGDRAGSRDGRRRQCL